MPVTKRTKPKSADKPRSALRPVADFAADDGEMEEAVNPEEMLDGVIAPVDPMDSAFNEPDLEDEEEEEDIPDEFVLSDDPVRMYLKEIGQVPLLDHNHETWLASQIAAFTLLNDLRKQGEEALGYPPTNLDVLRLLYQHLVE